MRVPFLNQAYVSVPAGEEVVNVKLRSETFSKQTVAEGPTVTTGFLSGSTVMLTTFEGEPPQETVFKVA